MKNLILVLVIFSVYCVAAQDNRVVPNSNVIEAPCSTGVDLKLRCPTPIGDPYNNEIPFTIYLRAYNSPNWTGQVWLEELNTAGAVINTRFIANVWPPIKTISYCNLTISSGGLVANPSEFINHISASTVNRIFRVKATVGFADENIWQTVYSTPKHTIPNPNYTPNPNFTIAMANNPSQPLTSPINIGYCNANLRIKGDALYPLQTSNLNNMWEIRMYNTLVYEGQTPVYTQTFTSPPDININLANYITPVTGTPRGIPIQVITTGKCFSRWKTIVVNVSGCSLIDNDNGDDNNRIIIDEYMDQNIADNTAISIYPNPANSSVTVQMNKYGDKLNTITVFNTLGQVVATQTTKGISTTQVNTNHLAAGTYLIEVKGEGFVARQKLQIID